MSFDDKHCFLCGTKIKQGLRSEEHIIPEWLQRKYNLWNNKVEFPNKYTKNYSSLKVACCFECNQIMKENLENRVIKIFEQGYNSIKEEDLEILYLWIGKIFFSFHFKDLFLKKNLRNKSKNRIRSKREFKYFSMLHMLLQAIRFEHVYRFYRPYSIYVYKTLKYSPSDDRAFDYIDSTIGMIAAIRFSDVGIICVFNEEGFHKEQTEEFHKKYVDDKQLHPIQFIELYAKALYLSMLFNRNSTIIVRNATKSNSVMKVDDMRIGFSEVFLKWDDKYFAKLFCEIFEKRFWKTNEEFFYKNGAVRTFFIDENEKPLNLKHDDVFMEYFLTILVKRLHRIIDSKALLGKR